LNREFGGRLDAAIEIFRKRYPKKFLCQMVSSQLDMDRLDYLRRDSFFTGVTEGVIGSDRIIKMLHVAGDELVVESKGVYSIEKFLLARRLMFWQVYLHKTVIAADQLLLSVIDRAKRLSSAGEKLFATPALGYFLDAPRRISPKESETDFSTTMSEALGHYVTMDDDDISTAIKMWTLHGDPVLSRLASDLVNRRLFRIEMQNEPFANERIESTRQKIEKMYRIESNEAKYFVHSGKLSNHAYNSADTGENILVMQRGKPVDLTVASDLENLFGMSKVVEKYFFCYPKEI